MKEPVKHDEKVLVSMLHEEINRLGTVSIMIIRDQICKDVGFIANRHGNKLLLMAGRDLLAFADEIQEALGTIDRELETIAAKIGQPAE